MTDSAYLLLQANDSTSLNNSDNSSDTPMNVSCRLLSQHSLLLLPLLTLGPILNALLIIGSSVLIAKLRHLLRNYAIAKAALISTSVCAVLVGAGSLLLHLHLLLLLLAEDSCSDFAQPLILCSLLLHFIHNAFRLACIGLAVLALDRLYFATKLHREIDHINHHNPSMYHNEASNNSRCPPLPACTSTAKAKVWAALVFALDRARIFFANQPIIAATSIIFSFSISIFWFSNLAKNSGTFSDIIKPVEICFEVSHTVVATLDRLQIISVCWVALGAVTLAHRICQTQLANFARSQYHITLAVRVKLRYTVTISKMVFPPIVANLIWQIICWILELTVNLAAPEIYQGPTQPLIFHICLLSAKTPPLIFFCIACLIRLKMENSIGPPHPAQIPALSQNFMSVNTRTTHAREGTTAGNTQHHSNAPNTSAALGQPSRSRLSSTRSLQTITSLPRHFAPARPSSRLPRGSITITAALTHTAPDPVKVDEPPIHSQLRRGSTIPALPPIHRPPIYVTDTLDSSDHSRLPLHLDVERDPPSTTASISLFYKTMESSDEQSVVSHTRPNSRPTISPSNYEGHVSAGLG